MLIDIAEAEEFSQGGDGGFGGEGACGGEFGAGVDDAGDDEGDGEIAVPAGGAGDEGVEPESPEGSEDGGDVPVGEAAAAGEGFVGGDEGFAFEDAAECFDGVIGEFGEVGEVRFFTLRPSRKDSRRRTAGGEFRLGTRSTYMTTEYSVTSGDIHPIISLGALYTWLPLLTQDRPSHEPSPSFPGNYARSEPKIALKLRANANSSFRYGEIAICLLLASRVSKNHHIPGTILGIL